MKPLISIIVPAYNSEAAIGDCLASIGSQQFRDFEVIVVDGASTDSTLSIVNRIEQKGEMRLKVVSEKDRGIYDAINKGIGLATGKWIYILGTDDQLYSKSTLAEVSVFLLSTKSKVVYGNVKVLGDSGWAKDGQVHDGAFPLNKLLQKNICQQSVFYAAEAFTELGLFKEQYKICADWDFILRCAARYKLEYMDVIVALFRGGGASTSGESENFYRDLPENLYAYFGRKILSPDFKAVAWRFAKAAADERKNGHLFRAWLFRRAGRKA